MSTLNDILSITFIICGTFACLLCIAFILAMSYGFLTKNDKLNEWLIARFIRIFAIIIILGFIGVIGCMAM